MQPIEIMAMPIIRETPHRPKTELNTPKLNAEVKNSGAKDKSVKEQSHHQQPPPPPQGVVEYEYHQISESEVLDFNNEVSYNTIYMSNISKSI